ncbi:MAG: type II toxin-antitoxin system VapC family toxin [Thermoanaerobaculia bacterium]
MFLDTSALYALLDRDDKNHAAAAKTWKSLSARDEDLVTTNYVLLEAFALVQNRLGLAAVRVLQQSFSTLLRILWIGEETHSPAVAALLTAGKRKLSLVDCVSFEAMRSSGVIEAFTFDRHFAEQGFEVLP